MSISKETKIADLLEEDKAIAGQKYVCISFVSPENILRKKEHFYFQEFLKHYHFLKTVGSFKRFINFISYKYNIKQEDITADFDQFAKSEKDSFKETTINDDYKNFLDEHEERLEKIFGEDTEFQTATRGIKVRGSFPTLEEAELRAKMLREVDSAHDIYVGPVGLWMPWEPEAYKTGRVEYLEEELNKLMHEKKKNEQKAQQQFDERVKDSKRRAIEENIKNATESGNKLTQTINADGDLVNVATMNTTENVLIANNDEISSADIRKELFEGDNIRTKDFDKNNSK